MEAFMKQVIFIFTAIALLLLVGCGKKTQAQQNESLEDESMLVSTSDYVPAEPAAIPPGPIPVSTARTIPASTVRPTPEYTIRKGDTLWGIAERQLGSGRRYREILDLNPSILDVSTIQVGTRIQLPAM
jgi:nucleoid-associated protein YgaU